MLMDAEFQSRDIPWSNCIAFGSDNASVMTGNKKGVIAFIERKQPSIYLSGCPLHRVHIAAKKAAGCLPPVDGILVDIYFISTRVINGSESLRMCRIWAS